MANVVIQIIEIAGGISLTVPNIINRILSFLTEMTLFVFIQLKYYFVESERERQGLIGFYYMEGGK